MMVAFPLLTKCASKSVQVAVETTAGTTTGTTTGTTETLDPSPSLFTTPSCKVAQSDLPFLLLRSSGVLA